MTHFSFAPTARFGFAAAWLVMVACASPEGASRDAAGAGASAGGGSATSGGATSGGATATGGLTSVSGASSSGGSPGTRGGATGAGGATTTSSGGRTGGGDDTSLPYFEDFEGVVGEPEWFLNIGEDGDPAGDWATVSDGTGKALQERSKTEENWAVGGSSLWKDQRLEVKVKIALTDPEDVADARFRIAVRYELDRCYYAQFQGNGKVRLGKVASSGGGDIGSEATGPAFTGGSWVTLALQAKGSALTAYVDGMQVAAASDTTIPSGGIALGSSEETAMLYDDVRVTAP